MSILLNIFQYQVSIHKNPLPFLYLNNPKYNKSCKSFFPRKIFKTLPYKYNHLRIRNTKSLFNSNFKNSTKLLKKFTGNFLKPFRNKQNEIKKNSFFTFKNKIYLDSFDWISINNSNSIQLLIYIKSYYTNDYINFHCLNTEFPNYIKKQNTYKLPYVNNFNLDILKWKNLLSNQNYITPTKPTKTIINSTSLQINLNKFCFNKLIKLLLNKILLNSVKNIKLLKKLQNNLYYSTYSNIFLLKNDKTTPSLTLRFKTKSSIYGYYLNFNTVNTSSTTSKFLLYNYLKDIKLRKYCIDNNSNLLNTLNNKNKNRTLFFLTKTPVVYKYFNFFFKNRIKNKYIFSKKFYTNNSSNGVLGLRIYKYSLNNFFKNSQLLTLRNKAHESDSILNRVNETRFNFLYTNLTKKYSNVKISPLSRISSKIKLSYKLYTNINKYLPTIKPPFYLNTKNDITDNNTKSNIMSIKFKLGKNDLYISNSLWCVFFTEKS